MSGSSRLINSPEGAGVVGGVMASITSPESGKVTFAAVNLGICAGSCACDCDDCAFGADACTCDCDDCACAFGACAFGACTCVWDACGFGARACACACGFGAGDCGCGFGEANDNLGVGFFGSGIRFADAPDLVGRLAPPLFNISGAGVPFSGYLLFKSPDNVRLCVSGDTLGFGAVGVIDFIAASNSGDLYSGPEDFGVMPRALSNSGDVYFISSTPDFGGVAVWVGLNDFK